MYVVYVVYVPRSLDVQIAGRGGAKEPGRE
jgi:hypothetical protein